MDLTAKIRIDETKHHALEEKIFGHFIEHLGWCIRNGIWDERKLARPFEFGRVRRDVFDAMAALRPPVIRWPGGCFSDTYHWRDGVGPARDRRLALNRAWFWLSPPETIFENNHFGTDEFIELCRRLGAEPYINVNFGAASAREAAEWVEYCNAAPGAPMSDLRAEYGHPEPYNVKIWGIANEIWGIHERGWCPTGDIYARRYLRFHRAMKAADESISCVAVGGNRTFPNWNRRFLELAAGETDYLSLHEYAPGPAAFHAGLLGYPDTKDAYYTMIAGADMFEESLLWFRETLADAAGEDTPIKIAFDEWNAWWKNSQLLRADDFTLRDGLLVACTLGRFIRHSNIIGMANLAQFVNTVGLILTWPDCIVLTPSYLAFKLYRDYSFGRALDACAESETVAVKSMGAVAANPKMPLVDSSATLDEKTGAVSVFAVNKHFDEPVSLRISFNKFAPAAEAETHTLASESAFDKNTPESPDTVRVASAKIKTGKTETSITLPPHSVTCVVFKKQQRKKK